MGGRVQGGGYSHSRLNLRSAWPIKKNLFQHFIENAAEDSCRAGKDRVRGSAGECCGSCCGRNWEDLDGEYYARVFGGKDRDSDMDMSDDDM